MEKTRIELLLELIANELLRLRIQLSPDDSEMAAPEGISDQMAERLDESIISLRKSLGMPISPFTP